MKTIMMFDVESIGLDGEGFSVGYVVVSMENWLVQEEDLFVAPSYFAKGSIKDREWAEENVTPLIPNCQSLPEMRAKFWGAWLRWKSVGCELWTDCGWPVETNFLSACIADIPDQYKRTRPYPLFDLSTALSMAGKDPIGVYNRLPRELPAHNPLNDARQSVRIFMENFSHYRSLLYQK